MERTAEWNPKIYKPQLSWPLFLHMETTSALHLTAVKEQEAMD